MSGAGLEGDAAPLTPGATIAGYEVIEHLRRGNDLDVYDAWSSERRARVAIKALRPDRLDRRRRRHSILHEGVLLLALTHPHIVRAYEVIAEPLPCVVLETLPGVTLAVLIEDGPPPAPADVGHLGLQLGSALAYLHANGHLHLDLKPSNVIADSGRAKLIDLSVARPPGPAADGIGTWLYMAPEQARGGVLGPAADVWGLGAVLFALATGEAPFDDDPDAWAEAPSASASSPAPDRYPQLERPARRPDAVRPMAAEVSETIAACLAPAPGERPELAQLMGRFEELAGLPAGERRWSRAQSASR